MCVCFGAVCGGALGYWPILVQGFPARRNTTLACRTLNTHTRTQTRNTDTGVEICRRFFFWGGSGYLLRTRNACGAIWWVFLFCGFWFAAACSAMVRWLWWVLGCALGVMLAMVSGGDCAWRSIKTGAAWTNSEYAYQYRWMYECTPYKLYKQMPVYSVRICQLILFGSFSDLNKHVFILAQW